MLSYPIVSCKNKIKRILLLFHAKSFCFVQDKSIYFELLKLPIVALGIKVSLPSIVLTNKVLWGVVSRSILMKPTSQLYEHSMKMQDKS
jgi:hypothetical protein